MTQPMDDLMQMAVEAELSNATGGIEGDGGCYYDYSDEIKRFAELVVKKAVEAEREKRKPLTDEQADMFWNSDDAERQHSSIEEFLNEETCYGGLEVGAVLTIWRAKKLPDVCIKVISIDEENCEAEYEVVAAAHGIALD